MDKAEAGLDDKRIRRRRKGSLRRRRAGEDLIGLRTTKSRKRLRGVGGVNDYFRSVSKLLTTDA